MAGPFRTNHDRRPAPPGPSELTDTLDRTATQVRIDSSRDDAPIHVLIASWSMEDLGVHYGTACHKVLAKVEGAILTTDAPTCGRCLSGGA